MYRRGSELSDTAGKAPRARSCSSSTRPWRESTGVHKSPLGCGPVGCRWHKGFGLGVHESTDPGLREKQHTFMERAPPEGARESCAPREWRGPMSIIMRATLHDPAPNTYYGQWPGRKAAVCGPRSAGHCPSRARCERQIRDRSRSGARFPRESLATALEICVSSKKKNLRVRRSG